jgi:hypothetical protein
LPPSAIDLKFAICGFRSQQIDSFSDQAMPITDTGKYVTLGVGPAALGVIPSSDFAGFLSRDARLKFWCWVDLM